MTANTARSASSEAGPRSPGRWLKVVLIASLAVNLLIAGAVAAALIGAHRGIGPFGGPTAGVPNLIGFLRTLPQERRDRIWKETAPERSSLGPMRKEMRQARDGVHRALATEPFDKERFTVALKSYDDTEARLRHAARGLMTAVAGHLTVDERRAYVQWQAQFRRGPKRTPKSELDEDKASEIVPGTPTAPGSPKP